MTERFGGRQVVLQALTGSHNYNLNTPESDEDWKFFVAPSFDDLYSGNMFSNGKQSDEFDYTVHDIRQLSHLLWKANPNFVEVLFSQNFQGVAGFPTWLLENRDRLATMHLRAFGFACLGMHKQKMGTLFKGTAKTQKLVDAFGFDSKDAHHAIRVLMLAERVAEGMPMAEAFWFPTGTNDHELLMRVKNNESSLEEVQGVVNGWFNSHFDRVEAFFKVQTPDTVMRNLLEHETKQFVKEQLMK